MPEQGPTRTTAHDDAYFKVLHAIDAEPSLSQRDLTKHLGISPCVSSMAVSVEITYYCLQALLEKDWIKAKNFKNNKNKIAYSYLLTPKAIDQKTRLTLRFLDRKR